MLTLQDVSKEYRSSRARTPVLAGISLSIAAGELCALTGPSGSGKSTLMNLIGLLDRPTAGEIKIDASPVQHLTSDELAAKRNQALGFVFQSFHLLPHLSALDNVALPLLYRGISLGERRKQAASVLQHVGLAQRTSHRPDELSGGQCQRVAIARALVTRPRLLLADEPTGNLDSKSAEDIMSLFLELNAELSVTSIIVTHDPSIAARCPRRIVLRDGRVFDDNRGELRSYAS
ncbi:ABC transporter ATP-binding protein [Mesorhizobium erdmanii]|uniref:ABC transporter ATP-binding protein n=1 Tax=Mesorhizobium erdmanii TaxID=1777866 RepID=A0A6M7UHK2_9HYPH|nr:MULTISPECIES: ABC transporter ATP-binding protein [Mesorhizobium]OBQ57845.1 macrolide ABC transporter ATP-binding protein [Mesorhizobium loti]QKC75563.1 ABC transporter ATP-binding protein [Mesorhizobium erdmanii]